MRISTKLTITSTCGLSSCMLERSADSGRVPGMTTALLVQECKERKQSKPRVLSQQCKILNLSGQEVLMERLMKEKELRESKERVERGSEVNKEVTLLRKLRLISREGSRDVGGSR